MSDLFISVGDTQVSPSYEVRDICVFYKQYLTFHDHMSGIMAVNMAKLLNSTHLDRKHIEDV